MHSNQELRGAVLALENQIQESRTMNGDPAGAKELKRLKAQLRSLRKIQLGRGVVGGGVQKVMPPPVHGGAPATADGGGVDVQGSGSSKATGAPLLMQAPGAMMGHQSGAPAGVYEYRSYTNAAATGAAPATGSQGWKFPILGSPESRSFPGSGSPEGRRKGNNLTLGSKSAAGEPAGGLMKSMLAFAANQITKATAATTSVREETGGHAGTDASAAVDTIAACVVTDAAMHSSTGGCEGAAIADADKPLSGPGVGGSVTGVDAAAPAAASTPAAALYRAPTYWPVVGLPAGGSGPGVVTGTAAADGGQAGLDQVTTGSLVLVSQQAGRESKPQQMQATAGPSIAGQTPVSNLPTTDHMACVLVSGLAWSATGKSIKAHFGEAEPTQVLFQPVNDINKAVVAFRTAAAATAALLLHGSVLQGNTLRVRLCSAPKSLKRPSPNPFTEGSLEHNQVNGSSGHMPPAPVFSVSVTGFATSKLSKKDIDSALHGGFSPCGHVVKVRLHLSTKPTKCSAVIEFNNPGAVEAACALSGSYIALGRLVVTRIRENGGGSSHVEGDFRPDGGGGNGGRASNKASKAQGQGRGGGVDRLRGRKGMDGRGGLAEQGGS
ncbi:MAG: hypothetical protein WDW38_005893 [Sanguina aurantia]